MLKKGRAAQTKCTGKTSEAALLAGDFQEAFCFLQGWYQDVTKVASKPCFQTVEQQTRNHDHLYWYVPSPVDPWDVEGGRPLDPEIHKRARGLPNNRAGGASQMLFE